MTHKYKIKRWLTFGMSAAFAIGLNGCSDSTTPGTATITTPTAAAVYSGTLVDGPVSGVSYKTPSRSGVTSAGVFRYADGEDVLFEFGDVKLGSARGKGKVTPMDILSAETDDERVQMMASLLQSLDEDGDHSNGMKLNDDIVARLNGKLGDPKYTTIKDAQGKINFETLAASTDTKNQLELLLNEVVDSDPDKRMKYVSLETAVENLIAATDSIIFRKNLSKTPTLPSAKSKLNLMTVYTEASKADDTQLGMDDEGNCIAGQMLEGKGDTCWTKPLVAAYTDIDKRTANAAPDAFMAISRDDGASWKRFNLARTGDKAVEVTNLPVGALGESKKPVFQAKGDKVLVAWTDKYCKGGKPRYAVPELDADGLPVVVDDKTVKKYDDFYGVAGSQDFIDYTKVVPEIDPARMPIPSSVAYSCLWTARATVKPWSKVGDELNAIQVYKAERMTSGTRDAYQVFVGGAGSAGMGITWQEDPEGLRPGSGDGPGHGFSGATTNHKTDVWYSYIKWADFAAIDTEDVAGSEDPDATPVIDDEIYDTTRENARVRALNHMSMPVRLTDNNMCNIKNIGTAAHEYCRLKEDGTLATWEGLNPDGSSLLPQDLTVLESMVNCSSFVDVPTQDGTQTVCVTQKGSILDGDTGASRPNLFLQPYTKKDGSVSAWAILAYEETKGVGVGPDGALDLTEDPEELGKEIYYHSFDMASPDKVAAGGLLNLPELSAAKEPIVLTMADGTVRYATENARRVRFILQGKKPSLGRDTNGDGIGDTGAGIPLIAIYKQGPEGKGRPSDIMLRRLSVRNADGSVKTGNPYAFNNFLCDTWLDPLTVPIDPENSVTLPATCNAKGINGVQNMSSVTPGLLLPPNSADTEGEEDTVTADDGTKTTYEKLMTWTVTTDDLLKESWETPMTESRAHRGQIRGDSVALGYVQTPNWAAARNGKDKYDFYVRRSFNGGATWTTSPKGTGVNSCWWERTELSADFAIKCETFAAGVFERPRNISLLKNAKESVIEPRVVAVPGTISACGPADAKVPCVGLTNPNEDVQNKNFFITAYGLAANENPDEAAPTDMYYARTSNFGESYSTVPHNTWVDANGDPLQVFDWMAQRKDVEEGEAQLRITPDGSKGYATYLSESGDGFDTGSHFYGSDIWFRKMGEADFNPLVETDDTETQE